MVSQGEIFPIILKERKKKPHQYLPTDTFTQQPAKSILLLAHFTYEETEAERVNDFSWVTELVNGEPKT